MHKNFKNFFVLSCFLFLSAFCSIAQNKNINPFPEKEYVNRIHSLLNILDTNSALVMKSAEFNTKSNDVKYDYKQESNFFYLTGINNPGYSLIIYKKGILVNNNRGISPNSKKCMSILFIPDILNETDNSFYSKIFDTILTREDFSTYYKPLPGKLKLLYYSAPDIPQFYVDWLNDKAVFSDANIKQTLKEKYPVLKLRSAGIIVGKLREIKSENEIKVIRKSIELTEAGLKRAIKNCKPGIWEYELQADIEYERMKGGGDGQAFPCIIGSGPNSVIIHYYENNRQTKENDLVVMDVGADFEGYTSDITRTIPVSGKFTNAQKDVYSIVLETQNEIIKFIKPGVRAYQLDSICKKVFKKYGYEKYFYHGVTHGVGLDVHDNMPDTLKPGMVITVEPGIYIAENDKTKPLEYRGFGIRIEDDVLVTPNGNEILTTGIPREIEDIEKMMKEK